MRARFFPLMIFLIVATALVFVVDDFVQQVIVRPMLYISWFILLVVKAIPQVLFWIAFIIVGVIIARKSMVKAKPIQRKVQMPRTSHRGPVATWSVLLERAETQDFSRWRLAQAFKILTSDILFPNGNKDLLPTEEGNQRTTSELPPEIAAYFEAPVPRHHMISRLWFRRGRKSRSAALNIDAEHVVGFLETELDPSIGDKA